MRYPHCILLLLNVILLHTEAYPVFREYCKIYGKNWEEGTEQYRER